MGWVVIFSFGLGRFSTGLLPLNGDRDYKLGFIDYGFMAAFVLAIIYELVWR